jgi:hypothetical protein
MRVKFPRLGCIAVAAIRRIGFVYSTTWRAEIESGIGSLIVVRYVVVTHWLAVSKTI